MSAVADKLLLKLDKFANEAKDEETSREIFDLKIRLRRGSLRGEGKAWSADLYKVKEEALREYLKERGLKWPGFVD